MKFAQFLDLQNEVIRIQHWLYVCLPEVGCKFINA